MRVNNTEYTKFLSMYLSYALGELPLTRISGIAFHSLMQDCGELILLSYSLTQSFVCRQREFLLGYQERKVRKKDYVMGVSFLLLQVYQT
jgi:hypothetical protein